MVIIPELTISAANIEDVEIIQRPSDNNNKSAVNKTSKTKIKAKNATTNLYNNNSDNISNTRPYANANATPSNYAHKTQTFPTGNARQILPSEEFDFLANLARFDKATEFKKIQADDSVPKGDRLVAINSPQRKLGVRESVLGDDDSERSTSTSTSSSVVSARISKTKIANRAERTVVGMSKLSENSSNDIMERFKHLSIPLPLKGKKSPVQVLVEEGTSDDDDVDEVVVMDVKNPDKFKTREINQFSGLPMISSKSFDSFCSSNPSELERSRVIGSINFAHHLLAELDQSRSIVLLLGVSEAATMLMETFYQLLNHGRWGQEEQQCGRVYAIFAAGAVGSGGKRIELNSSAKLARKRLNSLDRVQFTTSLGEIVKMQNVTIFDALGHDGEMTTNAVKGIKDWMKKSVLVASSHGHENKILVYGIEGCILGSNDFITSSPSNPSKSSLLRLVTFGIARDTILPSLKVTNSILYVDNGISRKLFKEMAGGVDTRDIYCDSFVSEVEY